MIKKLVIGFIIKIVFWVIVLGVGIWYLSSSLGGASLSYVSPERFMNSIGVQDGSIANANGCFMCRYVNDLFVVLGDASEAFWDAILDNLWVLLVIGFGIFLFIHTIKYLFETLKKDSTLESKVSELKFEDWFKPVKELGFRLLLVGAVLGVFGLGGVQALKVLSDIIIRPVMFIGSQLSMLATGVADYATCDPGFAANGNPMASISGSFMCVIGNINALILGGAAGGFTLMNYSWMGLGGGLFTWISGLALVILFLIVGFNLFFKLLSVLFKLILLVMFLPLFVAAYAFEKTWKLTKDIVSNTIKFLVGSAIRVIAITLQTVIMYQIVLYAADSYFPGPVDGYSAIMPQFVGVNPENMDSQTMSVMKVFDTCEKVSLTDGEINKAQFKQCFLKERATVEQKYPGAFDFADDGWGFLVLMLGLFFLYFYVVAPKVDDLLVSTEPGKEPFDDFGGDLKKLGMKIIQKPKDFADSINEKKNGTGGESK